MARSVQERTLAMELAVVLSPEDVEQHMKEKVKDVSIAPLGYEYSGSKVPRNIELIYTIAQREGLDLSLDAALLACFGEDGVAKVRHVLLVSGFYVLHDRHSEGLPGSGETDGPLGVMALARAFASRGVRVSVFAEEHNGPVIRAAYESMLEFLCAPQGRHSAEGEAAALHLEAHIRVLPFVSDAPPVPQDGAPVDILKQFPGCSDLLARAAHTAYHLRAAVEAAWGTRPGADNEGRIDCLFAIERLGYPYKNVRGRDISVHTEPVDFLWPPAPLPPGCPVPPEQAWGAGGGSFDEAQKVTARLRELAGILPTAMSLGIGDGGNEVGMGKVALIPDIAKLQPAGQDYAALAVNGCHRSCDHLLLATVSNWAGSAFEMATLARFPASDGSDAARDYATLLRSQSLSIADLELWVLQGIMRPPHCSVDGVRSRQTESPATPEPSVDGMAFEPYHRGLYELLWRLAGAGEPRGGDA